VCLAHLDQPPDFDSRDAQFLLGWNTTNRIPTGQGAKNYLVRRARVTLNHCIRQSIRLQRQTLRDYRTYFPTNDPRYLVTTNIGNPVELFGAGFSRWIRSDPITRRTGLGGEPQQRLLHESSRYTAGFDTNGILVDVSNNVGDDETNEITSPFEIAPFAVGQTTNVAPGQLMPVRSQLTFDLNLDDPLIYG